MVVFVQVAILGKVGMHSGDFFWSLDCVTGYNYTTVLHWQLVGYVYAECKRGTIAVLPGNGDDTSRGLTTGGLLYFINAV